MIEQRPWLKGIIGLKPVPVKNGKRSDSEIQNWCAEPHVQEKW